MLIIWPTALRYQIDEFGRRSIKKKRATLLASVADEGDGDADAAAQED